MRGAILVERRNREFTPELRERWLRAAAEEERARLANSRRALRDLAAVEEQTFSGELRRAMIASHFGIREIADQAQVPFETVNAFMGGEAVLDSDAISRIVRVLDCRLAGNG